jgi:hypothetical protein
MSKQRTKEIAHGWYYGPAMPTPEEATEHFRLCARRDPDYAYEYGEALSVFLMDRAQRPMRVMETPYVPADSHVDSTEFRKRLAAYSRIGPPLPEFKDGDSE